MPIAPLIDRTVSRARSNASRLVGALSKESKQDLARARLEAYRADASSPDFTSFAPSSIDAYEPPDPDAYRATWETALADLEQLLDDASGEATGLKRLINQRESLASQLAGSLQKLESRVQAAELFSEGTARRVETLLIDFSDPSLSDSSLVMGQKAFQDVDRGVLTQAVASHENRTSDATIVPVVGKPVMMRKRLVRKDAPNNVADLVNMETEEYDAGYGLIGDQANGLPGNTHEVEPIESGDLNGTTPDSGGGFAFEFVGMDDAHLNYGQVLDASVDSWFEYEAVNVPDEVKEKTKGYGWAYDLGGDTKLVWAFDPKPDGVLRLTLRVHFEDPVTANQIRIHPFVPPNDGAKPPILKRVRMADDRDVPTRELEAEITQGPKGEWTLSFPPQPLQTLDLLFEQPFAFDVKIGHWAYFRTTVTQTHDEYLFGLVKANYETQSETSRIDGSNPPISQLGIAEATAAQKAGAALATAGTLAYAVASAAGALGAAALAGVAALGPVALAAIGVGVLLSGLYQKKAEVLKDDVDLRLEAFDGRRWCIGVREIEALSKRYAQRSQWVSKPIRASGPIRSVRVEAAERVPVGYPDPSVRYEISFDDGKSWHPIRPASTWKGDAPEIIYVGSPEAVEGDPKRVGVVESDPVDTFRVRLTMTGPSDRPYETLEVDSMQIWVETGEAA